MDIPIGKTSTLTSGMPNIQGSYIAKLIDVDRPGVVDDVWCVNIKDVSDIKKIMAQEKLPIIIDKSFYKDVPFELEIYDDYRE